MTDKELIQALQCCYGGGGCKSCLYKDCSNLCMKVNPVTAADRLEALREAHFCPNCGARMDGGANK